MGILGWASDDSEAMRANAEAGLTMRVKWVKKLRAELARLMAKYPHEKVAIQKALDGTKEWL